MKDKYSFESTIGYTTMNELYLLLTELNIFFEEEYKFSENCKMFSDFFKIKEGQNKSKNNQASTLYEQKGKRVYFECLIDILLNDDPNKNRKCMEI